jgi:NAD(P)H-hydrate repair Nnr-like enzyme with NAD(P)H-hydrate dehydratase domain
VNEVAEVVFKAVTAHALAGREVAKLIAPVTATDILERLPYLLRDYQENTID